jgi:uncharacterized protein (TIGR00369 family)
MKRTEPGMSPFWDYIGMKEVELGDGHSVIRLEVTENLLQRRSSVHGGVLATLIDAAIGSAVRSELSEEQFSATVEMKINYLRPAKGSYLLAKGQIVQRGKNLAVGSAEILNDEGKLVAMGTGTFMVFNGDGK